VLNHVEVELKITVCPVATRQGIGNCGAALDEAGAGICLLTGTYAPQFIYVTTS